LSAWPAPQALAWCDEHRARLRKVKSKLEFKLYVQQFIELVRQERRLDAIAYARGYLEPWATLYMAELQRAVATLAFSPRTRCAPYKALFEDAQWEMLVELFLKDLYRMHGLTPDSMLHVYIQAGLAALKTSNAGEAVGEAATGAEAAAGPAEASAGGAGGVSSDDPLRLPAFQQLARGLPISKHGHSKLVCSITRDIMTDDNPPVVLPNGFVYSQKGVSQVMARNGGQMRCPRTGAVYAPEELRRAYIV
jgi:macrophage erythroblast attacher